MLQFPVQPNFSSFQDKLQRVEILRQTLAHMPLNETQLQSIFHHQLFKSALFSARIEGNTLTLETAQHLDLEHPKQKKARELGNIAKTHSLLATVQTINLESLKTLHASVMKELIPSAGKLRNETTAIFDQQGNVVYITPSPEEMQRMLAVFFDQINAKPQALAEQLFQIIACHYYFEKIHPFIDGNGRTGRMLLHWQCQQFRLFGSALVPIEEYFDAHRSEYYFHLEKNTTHIEAFFQFFLEALIWSLEKQLEEIKNAPAEQVSPALLPRRQEIINIITDHPLCSLDFIARRFPTIPVRTIQYDLARLIQQNLVKKHGQTRGAVYSTVD